jgi:phenylacetate-coenzyme A ligase PaaK-like adenylate-forming protein
MTRGPEQATEVDLQPRGHWRIWSRPPLLWVRLGYLTLLNTTFSALYRFVRSHYRLWYWLSQHSSPRTESLGRLNAYLMCALARKNVPAYGSFLEDSGYVFRILELDAFPETTKDNYVRRYGFEERCRRGRIPIVGTVVDESAGSSGTPYNWLRSERELRDVHLNTANWIRFTFPTERLFAINAFSMGAWATGTNMGIALSKVAMVKSTGPELEKVVDTIEQFGDRFEFLVAAYPPFLKHVVDALDERGFDWERTRMYGAVGGEALTEAMRDHLERRLVKVRSGYGASDVQIGIGGETDLSVFVRKLLVERADVREALLGPDEPRIPMVFQYNPLENYIEVNDAGDTVVTLNNSSVLAPKLRYNVGDEGSTMTRAAVVEQLSGLGAVDQGAPLPHSWAAPFLFLYGRRDGTVSYMGANIYPTDIEYGLYRDETLAGAIESFCLELREASDLESRPIVHVQLRAGARVDRDAAADQLRAGLLAYLVSSSRDFAESVREDASAADIRVVLHDHAKGPFAATGSTIKNVYVIRPR